MMRMGDISLGVTHVSERAQAPVQRDKGYLCANGEWQSGRCNLLGTRTNRPAAFRNGHSRQAYFGVNLTSMRDVDPSGVMDIVPVKSALSNVNAAASADSERSEIA